MNGRSWATIALFLVMSLSAAVLDMDSVEGQDHLSMDLVIDGNDELSSSEYVRGGPGTEASPYIISDLDFGSGSLDIRNITYYLVIRNITFDSGEDTAIHVYNTYGILISNVSYTGRDVFMHLRSIRRPIIQNCHVENIPDGSYFLRGDSLVNPVIRRNNLSSEGISLIEFDRFGGGLQMSENDFHGMCITDKFFYQYDKISDNSFVDSYVNAENGTEAGVIEGNTFESSKYNGVISYKCNELKVLNNTFTARIGILIRNGANNYRGVITGNEFKECQVGIRAPSYYSDGRFVQWKIRGNTFRSCKSYAMAIDEPRYIEVWENRFIDNAGKTDGESGSQVDFLYDSTDNQFTVDGIGNYWSNHRVPDENSDGIVDEPYPVDYFTEDERPYSNVHFDTDRPSVLLHSLDDDQEDRSYIHFSWEVNDSGSGFHRAELSVDGDEYDVTGLSGFPVLLPKGDHIARLTGWDVAGMKNSSELDIVIPAEVPIVTFTGMNDGDYINTPRVRAAWKIPDYFEPAEQVISLDGVEIVIPSDSRAKELDLEPGWNSIKLTVRDRYVTEVNRTIRVYLDDEKPSLRILSPADGSYLSNRIVKIRWEMEDNIYLATAMYRLDQNDWQDSLDTRELSSLLDTGEHTFYLMCSDKAGNTVTASSTFHVADDPDLQIISPMNDEVTSTPTLDLEWEYGGNMEWVGAFVIMDSGDPYGIAQIRKIEIPFDDLVDAYRDGDMTITLRLVDAYENHIEKSISITLDREGPGILLMNGPDSDIISDPDHVFSWKGFDDTEIDHYEVRYDSGEWIDVGSGTSHATRLRDGEHILSIAAFDTVGNAGRLDHHFVMDSTPPEIILISSTGDSWAIDPVVTIQWEISDLTGIARSLLEVDIERPTDVTDRNSIELILKEDGEHTVELTAEDMAGNTESESMVIRVDTNAPSLSWKTLPDGYVSSGTVRIEWDSRDVAGISEQFMDLDGERYDLEPDADGMDLDISDGEHTVRIHAADRAGHESMIETVLKADSLPPFIELSEVSAEKSDDPGLYAWDVMDGESGNSVVEMRIDNGDWTYADEAGTYSPGRLSPGDHTLRIKAVDNAGNTAEESITFTVEKPDAVDSGRGAGVFLGAGALFLIIVLAAAGAAAWILVRKKGKGGPDEKAVPKTPERISLPNIPAVPRAGQKISAALPPSGEKVLEATTGTGYIRPSKEEKKPVVKHDNTLDLNGNRIP
ncbi:MAG: right-handed parallel beta-helix repeat-containing protein [Thermoplasmatota archaeon]